MSKKLKDNLTEAYFGLFNKKGLINLWKFTHLEHLFLGFALWFAWWWVGLFFILVFIGYNSLILGEMRNNLFSKIKNLFKKNKENK